MLRTFWLCDVPMRLLLKRCLAVLAFFIALSSLHTVYRLSSGPSIGSGRKEPYVRPPKHFAEAFPPPVPESSDYREWNAYAAAELHACVAARRCAPNQEKVALLAAVWFEEAVLRGFRGGEGIWAYSVHKALREMGYTTFFANSFEEALTLYRTMPDLVKVVIRNMAGECHNDPTCVKSPTNPTGIPAWKIFDFEYFPSLGVNMPHYSRMEGKWVLSAHPHDTYQGVSPIQFIGFSIEEQCNKNPVVPLAQRPARVWLLMKQLAYVYKDSFAWERAYFLAAARELGFTFVGSWKMDQDYQRNSKVEGIMEDIHDPAAGVVNLRHHEELSPQRFREEMGMSRVMLGLGLPWWSPSPYEALCVGVPFVNPIMSYDESDPWNKNKWYMVQHPSLVRFDPPYVYHVHKNNYTQLAEALRQASTTEIGRLIPGYMTDAALRKRLVTLMETDWRAKAAELLEERLKTPGSYVFEL